ncbi:hypothetical protein SLEP1_g57843 [Rubroshorea leprosula]|uniref:Glycosyltransferase n=1 Tax=Rubroshorea leprosula TaxID=152421 RepID=A0AAV5MMG1_9ROSI|nr:hypothetical protein SLEP1_g57843 [Rubroshorea leprosula]
MSQAERSGSAKITEIAEIPGQSSPTLHRNHHRFSKAKSLDFSTWVADNFYKIVTICILIFTVEAIFFLYNATNTASFLQLQSKTQQSLDSISLPQIKWNSIATISDKSSPYANFRSEQWIVVSVSDYSSDSLKKMAKIRGWQVLAIGNSRTPKDWTLKGRSLSCNVVMISDDPNSTVVNPHIHFGQRSVWPSGLPLENVDEIGHCEEFYTEVFGGKQYIQQEISNGLPDVDSVFYFTRMSGLKAFDIRFDEHAPKVALPQGMMVPGRRLLWEIGGYVVVYPPTIHSYDRNEAFPFSEEKDLHVNVGRLSLIKFLVSWRSNKHELFDKILELSYAMAEEGLWTDKDLKFTAAWLQDLLAVGNQQPRLMSLELDRPRKPLPESNFRIPLARRRMCLEPPWFFLNFSRFTADFFSTSAECLLRVLEIVLELLDKHDASVDMDPYGFASGLRIVTFLLSELQ